ncbi:MAG TPA: IS200/IS605 family transposase [Phnomibacter sp.]|nr:IS200/IS605 family transposase [Phnomibacter sp.]
MPQSLVKNYIHIVFSTKYRQPFITKKIENALYAYIGAMCNDMDCPPIKIGGHLNHVHILCLLSRKVALMDLLEEIKAHSSKWMKTNGPEFTNFYWQDGYAAFSVSSKEVDKVILYIEHQHEHHETIKFQDEMRAIFVQTKTKFDERYCWD